MRGGGKGEENIRDVRTGEAIGGRSWWEVEEEEEEDEEEEEGAGGRQSGKQT